MSDEIRIVIADDHAIVRKGLRDVIEEEPDLVVAAEAPDGEAALAAIEKLRPSLAVLDLRMPKLDGLGVAGQIRKRNLPLEILFLTLHEEVDLLHKAMELGKAYILKESALVDIVNGIRSVVAGRRFVSPSMAAALLDHHSQTQEFRSGMPALADLTPSERRILSMVASGKPTKVIATELHLHHRTIETHRANISHKLHLNGANSLLRFALEHKQKLLD